MTRRHDLSLMLVTDTAMCRDRGLVETVLAAVSGGVTVVQLRDKTCSDGEMIDTARTLRAHLAPLGVPLIVNDRPAVALAAGAHGVHIGQGDGDPAAARAMVGPDALLGLSVTGPENLATVDSTVVDYIGLGPVFASATKADATPPLGLAGFEAIATKLSVPVLAIGGVDAGNAGGLMAAGAAGVAVVSAICAAPDPAAAAAAVRRAMERTPAA